MAEIAEQFFINQFQNKNFEEKVFEPVSIELLFPNQSKISLIELCHQLKKNESKSFIRRLIESGGIQINNVKITDSNTEIKLLKETKIKIGKRDFFELV